MNMNDIREREYGEKRVDLVFRSEVQMGTLALKQNHSASFSFSFFPFFFWPAMG